MKRFAAIFLTMAMLLSLVPITVWAEDGAVSKIEVSSHYVCEEDTGVTNEELFAAYAQREFDAALGIETPSFYRTSALEAGTLEKEIYDKLKVEVAKVASGYVTSTKIIVSGFTKTWSAEELKVTELFSTVNGEQKLSEAASSAISSKLDLIYHCLLADCPQEMYWHDKTQRSPISFSYYLGNSPLQLAEIYFDFKVSADYADKSDTDCYTTDSTKTGATTTAVTNAMAVVEANAFKSDLEKLKAYKDEICALVSYDQDAVTNTNTPYGDPWQLISVFDEVTTTNVVCEGYAKAFQFLCDLSAFSGDIECHTVTGTMAGGTGAGAHMWNVITMDDEKNYLVDVTNCDTDTIGTPDKLFMAYTANSANANQTHTFTIGSDNVVFTYDAGMSGLFCNGYLALATTAYVKPSTPSYEAQWGLATGVNSDGMPADDDWTKGTLAEAMTYANNLTSGAAYIQLLSDVDTKSSLWFDQGKTTILDLDGNTIDRGLTKAIDGGYVIRVRGNLTLCDTSTDRVENQGKITGGNNSATAGCLCVEEGVFTMDGGIISGNTAPDGAGVQIIGGGTFIMNGGLIAENTALEYGGGVQCHGTGSSFIMNGGSIEENTAAYYGGGVHCSVDYDAPTFIINGGAISGNTAGYKGGGVYSNCKDFAMNGGSISGNNAETGGGVYVNGRNFTIKGGSIEGNNAETGGGVYNRGTMKISGTPVIVGNVSNGTRNETTGLFEKGTSGSVNNVYHEGSYVPTVVGALNANATIGMASEPSADGTIIVAGGGDLTYSLTENDAAKFSSDNGGNIVLDSASNKLLLKPALSTTTAAVLSGKTVVSPGGEVLLTLTLSGINIEKMTATLEYNSDLLEYANSSSIHSSWYASYPYDNVLTITGTNKPISSDTDVVVLKFAVKEDIATGTSLSVALKDIVLFGEANEFNVADTTWSGTADASPEARWGLATGTKNDQMPNDDWVSGLLTEAVAYANGLPPGTAYIQLLRDVDTTAVLTFAESTTTILDLHGKTIDRGLTYYNYNGNIITVNGNLTLCDTSENAATAPGKITGGNSRNGGGVYVDGGQFTMKSGAISGNCASNGGGVYVYDGTFIMNDGSIFGNTAENSGGGVYTRNSTFTMTNGYISKNTAENSGGGGVHAYGGTFEMNGGYISENVAYYGGGVYNSENQLTMNGGTISRNTSENGGGVYVGGTFTMEDGTISQNTAGDGSGGGVAVLNNDGSFTMNNGAINGNTANSGGGVCVSESFTMTGGTISGNTAAGGGGVAIFSRGTFTMTEGTITRNTATASMGGGVQCSNTVTMSGGTISGNISKGSGGGVSCYGTLTMSGGSITGNSSDSTIVGGAYVSGAVEVSGDAIISENFRNGTLNEATGLYEKGKDGSAGNLYLYNGTIITVTDDLGKDAAIGVMTYSRPTSTRSIIVAQGGGDTPYTLDEDDAAKFASDYGYLITLDGASNTLVMKKAIALGDANGDGTIDIGDHQRLFEHLQGIDVITDAAVLTAVDVNKDGVVDIGDHQRLFEHLQGINPLS